MYIRPSQCIKNKHSTNNSLKTRCWILFLFATPTMQEWWLWTHIYKCTGKKNLTEKLPLLYAMHKFFLFHHYISFLYKAITRSHPTRFRRPNVNLQLEKKHCIVCHCNTQWTPSSREHILEASLCAILVPRGRTCGISNLLKLCLTYLMYIMPLNPHNGLC